MQLFSEPEPTHGAMSAEAYKNLLGRMELNFWSTFVRETIQNSWDASKGLQKGPVVYSANFREFKKGEWDKAFKEVFNSKVPEDIDNVDKKNQVDWKELSNARQMLIISDRNTTGMGGPTAKQQQMSFDASEVPADFTAFVFSWGSPQDTLLGGGTYGYGKSVLYSPSKASTIIVHTHCLNEKGEFEKRIIACSLAHSGWTKSGKPVTGRHWWGNTKDYEGVGPVIGERADQLASLLGFPIFPNDESTGTSIAVISPSLTDEDGNDMEPQAFMEYLQMASLWNCWPKLVAEKDGQPEMLFNFAVNGEELNAISPDEIEDLHPFCDAFRKLDNSESDFTTLISSAQPKKELGRLSINPFPESDKQKYSLCRPFEGKTHHVALMRTVNLVVNYEKQVPHPLQDVGFAGVFRVNEQMDADFKKFEPPAHDVWESKHREGLPKPNFANIAKSRIKDFVNQKILMPYSNSGETGVSVGHISELLGSLFTPGGGTGPGGDSGTHGGGLKTSKPQVVLHEHEIGTGSKNEKIHTFPFEVFHAANSNRTSLTASVSIGLEDGRKEGTPPAGSRAPEIVGFIRPDGKKHDGNMMTIEEENSGVFKVVVKAGFDVQVILNLDSIRADKSLKDQSDSK